MSAAALANVQLASRAAAAVQHRSRELEERLMRVEVAMANRPDISSLMLAVGELKAEDAAVLEKLSGNLLAQSHAAPLPNSELPTPADRASEIFVSYSGRLVGDDHHTDIMTIDEAKGFAIADPEIKGFTVLNGNQIAATTTFKTEWKLVPDDNYISYAKGNIACGCNSSYCTPGSRSWSCCGMRNEFSDCTTSAHGAHWGQYRLHSIDGSGSGGQCLINTLLPDSLVSVGNNQPTNPTAASTTPPRSVVATEMEEIPPPVTAASILMSQQSDASRHTEIPPSSAVSQSQSAPVVHQSAVSFLDPPSSITQQHSVQQHSAPQHSTPDPHHSHHSSNSQQFEAHIQSESYHSTNHHSVSQSQLVDSPPGVPNSSPQVPHLEGPSPSRNFSEEQTNLEWDRNLQLAREGAAKIHSRATVRAQSVLPDTIVDIPGDDTIIRRESSVVSPPAVKFRELGSPGKSAWRGGSLGAEAFWRARSERGAGGGIGAGQTPVTEHDAVNRRLWKELERAGVDVSQLAVSIAADLGTTLPPPASPEAFNPPVVNDLPPEAPHVGELTTVFHPTVDINAVVGTDPGHSSEILKHLHNLQLTVNDLARKVHNNEQPASITSSSLPPTPPDDGLNVKHGGQAIRVMLKSGPLTNEQTELFLERLCGSLLLPMGSIQALPRTPGCDLRICFKSPSSHHQLRIGLGFVEQCNASPANPLLESLGIIKAFLETEELEPSIVSFGPKPRRRVAACIPPTPSEPISVQPPASNQRPNVDVVSTSAPSVDANVFEPSSEVKAAAALDTPPTITTQHIPSHVKGTPVDLRIPPAPYAISPSQHLENAQSLLSMWDNADVYKHRG
eukprot:TRINITY_DN3469_c1_g1_i2.p1 TRINITY_DN3469_c1_g1~~TRINITY_DN3469_c1_g1_i2.p1  ORF type:complete len:876 (+),score=179.41 TRINITY_DN3469_c1_g1_i2:102-2630(+)